MIIEIDQSIFIIDVMVGYASKPPPTGVQLQYSETIILGYDPICMVRGNLLCIWILGVVLYISSSHSFLPHSIYLKSLLKWCRNGYELGTALPIAVMSYHTDKGSMIILYTMLLKPIPGNTHLAFSLIMCSSCCIRSIEIAFCKKFDWNSFPIICCICYIRSSPN